MLNYTTHLLNTRGRGEQDSLNSIELCNQYDRRINELEGLEKKKLMNLNQTMRQNQVLLHDLSRKSVSMTNKLVARNPIPPIKEEPLPGHSQYSYVRKNRLSIDDKYQNKLAGRLKQLETTQPAGQ